MPTSASNTDRPALLIIDMLNDYFDERHPLPIADHARRIIPAINRLIAEFHQNRWPVVFSTDAFTEDDFLFQSRMTPHAIAGTDGAAVIPELDRQPGDLWLPKPRFSAFFRTGLEETLREERITLCVVAGIATHFCVLTTALDAICHDFKAVIAEDASAAGSEQTHAQALDLYRRNPLYPLFRVLTADAILDELLGPP